MIRIDFVTAQPTSQEGEVNTELCSRVIMTPQGFVNMLGTMTQLSEQLVDGGVLGKKEEAPAKKVRKKKE